MVKKFILLALRGINKHRLSSALSILMLSISMSIALIVIVVVGDQFNYDIDQPFVGRLYRIITNVTTVDGRFVGHASSPYPLGEYLLVNNAGAEQIATIKPFSDLVGTLKSQNKRVKGAFATPSLFTCFHFKIIHGDVKQFSNPNTVVLGAELSKDLFGNENPVGKTITISSMGEFVVEAVFREERNTHLNFQLFASAATINYLLKVGKLDSASLEWNSYYSSYNYLLLKEGHGVTPIKSYLQAARREGMRHIQFRGTERDYEFDLQSLSSVTPGKLMFETGAGLSFTTIYTMIFVAVVVVGMALFNYANLSLSRYLKRTKEMGVRRVHGATSVHVISQVFVESTLLAFIALVVGYFLSLVLPLNNALQFAVDNADRTWAFYFYVIVFTIIIGALAAVSPSLFLSRIKPLNALNDKINIRRKGISSSNVIIIFQFFLATTFLICLTAFYRQASFMQYSDYGFASKDVINVAVMDLDAETLSNEFSAHTKVKQVAKCSGIFGYSYGQQCFATKGTDSSVSLDYFSADENVVPVMQLEIVAGTNFVFNDSKLEQYIVLNESAVDALGWQRPHEAVGQFLLIDDTLQLKILGVLKDFHYNGFKQTIKPFCLRYRPSEFKFVNIKAAPSQAREVMLMVTNWWTESNSNFPFDGEYYEEAFKFHHGHSDDVALTASVTMVAIAISCLGLLGVVIQYSEGQIQSIAIKRVLGASTKRILIEFSRQFLTLLIVAFILGAPLGYIISKAFLNRFAYKIDLEFSLFALCFGILIFTGFLIVCLQVLKITRVSLVGIIRRT